MDRKGFTIIELLAVICILGLILVIVMPMAFNISDNAKKSLSANQEKSILDAGELVGIDLDDYKSSIFNCKNGSWIKDKCELNDKSWGKVELSVEDLKEHNYFKDDSDNCKGKVIIRRATDAGYDIDYSDVKCK